MRPVIVNLEVSALLVDETEIRFSTDVYETDFHGCMLEDFRETQMYNFDKMFSSDNIEISLTYNDMIYHMIYNIERSFTYNDMILYPIPPSFRCHILCILILILIVFAI